MDNPTAVVKTFYAALDRGDRDAAFSLLDEEFELVQAESLPYGGTWRGSEGIRAFFDQLSETWTDFGSRDTQYFADEGTVVALSTAEGETKGGEPFEMPMIQVYTVRDGKLVETRPFYFDTAAVNRVTGHSPS